MYCVQCEQTVRSASGNGCNRTQGVCGKTAETSDLQDLLIAMLQSLSAWAMYARQQGIIDHDVDRFSPRAVFATLTNVNFDSARIVRYALEAQTLRDKLRAQCQPGMPGHPLAGLTLAGKDIPLLRSQAQDFALNHGDDHEDILGLRLLCLYGLKGAAAYMEHAQVFGHTDNEICAQYHEIMAWLGTRPDDADALLAYALRIGKMNAAIMALLDNAQTSRYGDPQPVSVNIRPQAGKAILVSGHDLNDLHLLLEQTAGHGINVYTHGELLPAHGYPGLKKYSHLVGNYGSGWQNQQEEFARFPGPIIMTSNCIINPEPGGYQQRIWTRNMVGWPGVNHLENDDFSAVIAQAQTMPGFLYSDIPHEITVGFGRKALLDSCDAIIERVASKKLRHVFLVGGCDGGRSQRSYYTDFAAAVPNDCLILTLGCGKYRFNKFDFGQLDGLPRLLDIGQCNDSHAALMLATRLAEKLGCGINDLPLSLVLSWFEQKAIVILLTLLALGVKNVRTGPSAPGFLSENLLKRLQNEFGLRPITTIGNDLATMLTE